MRLSYIGGNYELSRNWGPGFGGAFASAAAAQHGPDPRSGSDDANIVPASRRQQAAEDADRHADLSPDICLYVAASIRAQRVADQLFPSPDRRLECKGLLQKSRAGDPCLACIVVHVWTSGNRGSDVDGLIMLRSGRRRSRGCTREKCNDPICWIGRLTKAQLDLCCR